MVIRISFFFTLVLLSISLLGQNKKINYRKLDKINSEKQIVELHNGVLLVRLFDKQKHIDGLKKVGKLKASKKIEREQLDRNKQIVYAFKNYYDFSKVYFFFSDQSKFISDNLSKVKFVNDSLEVDTSIKVNSNIIFIAEFGITEPDTRVYSKEQYYENGQKKTKSYSGSGITLSALVFKNKNFVQLREPFPYYVRERKSTPFQSDIETIVTKMNAKLKRYYDLVKKKD